MMKWLTPTLFLFAISVAGCQISGPKAGSSITSSADGAILVFVPAGEFMMGSSESDPNAESDERPQHTVNLDGFWIDRTEVTNDMYRQCVQAGKCTEPAHSRRYGLSEYANHPILGVSWYQALEYCNRTGRRLPTEAEWEKAARGTDGRLYPWGNDPPDSSQANFNHFVDDTTEVGNYPSGASPFGVLDMAGNVWEWVADGYDESYYPESPYKNPLA